MSRKGQTRGFTLIEVLITIAALAVVFGALPSVFESLVRNSIRDESQTVALLLARDKMEEFMVVKSLPRPFGYDAIQSRGPEAFEAPFGKYTSTVATSFKSYDGVNFYNSSINRGYKQIIIRVTGPDADSALTSIIGDYGG